MIEPTNACNFRCVSCSKQNSKDNRAIQFMKIVTFEKIINQFPDLNNIIFCGIGEALLNPDLIKMIEIAKKKEIKTIRLVTNGSGLTKSVIDNLSPFLTHINISVNGFSPESYARFNGVDISFFERVMENIKKLVAARDSLGTNMKICISAVLTKQNISDFDIALKFCKELKVDSFIGLQFNHFDKELTHLKISKKEQNRVLQRLKRDSKKYKIRFEFLSSAYTPRCYLLWNAAYIGVDGAVTPCNGYFDFPLKWNLLEDNFIDIWHSKDFVDMRKKVIAGQFPYCKSCSNGPSFNNVTFHWLYGRYIKPVLKKLICRA